MTTGTITINSGHITATGNYGSTGIGGGVLATSGTITINGGVVTAISHGGQGNPAAIGGGEWMPQTLKRVCPSAEGGTRTIRESSHNYEEK